MHSFLPCHSFLTSFLCVISFSVVHYRVINCGMHSGILFNALGRYLFTVLWIRIRIHIMNVDKNLDPGERKFIKSNT